LGGLTGRASQEKVASFAIEDTAPLEPPFDGMVEPCFESPEDLKRDVQGGQRKIM
jgi:hypothetical protein